MDLIDILSSFGKQTGEYWSGDNANFEKTKPDLGNRAVRALNPFTGFGSALGAMHDGASQGSEGDMALAALQAWPAFGLMKSIATPAVGASKALGTARVNDWANFGKWLGLGTGTSVTVDEAQARSTK